MVPFKFTSTNTSWALWHEQGTGLCLRIKRCPHRERLNTVWSLRMGKILGKTTKLRFSKEIGEGVSGYLLLLSLSGVSNSLEPHGLQHTRLPCPSPSPKITHVHWVSDAIQPSHPLSSPSPPTFNLSQLQGLFHTVSSLHQVAKVLEFHLQHQSFLSIFRVDWFDLFAVQGTLKSLLQHHSSKASILHYSAFLMVQSCFLTCIQIS